MTLDLGCRYFLLFFFCSMLGWLMEVTCKLFQFHRFINRGFLIGPDCPIYGFGAVFVTLLLSGFSDHPVAVFLLAMLVCGTLEYVTSYVMEKLFHARWWDYSQRKFNLNGRVCANTLIPFGLLGLVMVYFLKPLVFGWFDALSETALYALSGSLAALLLTDTGDLHHGSGPHPQEHLSFREGRHGGHHQKRAGDAGPGFRAGTPHLARLPLCQTV